jgi:hypothetical protein
MWPDSRVIPASPNDEENSLVPPGSSLLSYTAILFVSSEEVKGSEPDIGTFSLDCYEPGMRGAW